MHQCCTKQHPDHSNQLSKLNRAVGQLDGVKKMIEERRYCVDIITQIKAARAALKSVELGVLETHMHGCLADTYAMDDSNAKTEKIQELMNLLKKYE